MSTKALLEILGVGVDEDEAEARKWSRVFSSLEKVW